jgi:hypothetical protein
VWVGPIVADELMASRATTQIVEEGAALRGAAGETEATSGARAGAADPKPAPYNRSEHYGNPATSKAATEIRQSAEGQPCPSCGKTMKSGTANAPTAQSNAKITLQYGRKENDTRSTTCICEEQRVAGWSKMQDLPIPRRCGREEQVAKINDSG